MALFDLLRPQWKHSDPARRAEAIRLLEDNRQDVFLAALADDSDPVRRAAARRVKGEENARKALTMLGARDDKATREVLHKTLLPLVAGRLQAARGMTGDEAASGTAEIAGWPGGEKALETLAVDAVDPVVRRAALARLTHAGGILAVALKEADADLALEAFGRLTRDAHYESAARNAKSRAVREAARVRLRELEEAKKPDAATIARAKAAILMSTVAKAAAAAAEAGAADPAFDWAGAHEHVEDAARAFEALQAEGLDVPAADRARFAADLAAFREREAVHAAAEAARRARDEAEARLRAIREGICDRLEGWYAESRTVTTPELEELARAYRDAGAAGNAEDAGALDDDPLSQRFLIARERLSERIRRQRDADEAARSSRNAAEAEARAAQRAEDREAEAARREAARAEAGPALEAVIAELEKLAAAADPKTGDKRLRELQAHGKELLALLGDEGQGAGLRYHAAADHLRETLEWSRWSNLQRKQALLEQLESLAHAVADVLPDEPVPSPAAEDTPESSGEPASGPPDAPVADATPTPPEKPGEHREATRPLFVRFKELLAEWKTIGPVTWDAGEAVWDRYQALADGLYEKFREFFAELDEEREANFKAREELCAKLEELMASPEADSRETNEAFREAHSAWKAIGAVPREKREQADALWERFRAVNKAYQEKREGAFKENLAAKRALIERAEELKDSTAWKKTADRIKELQEQWKAIGPVPRDKANAVWNRFHAACETFFTARRAFYEQLDAERPANLEKKIALCERVEKLDELADDRARYEAILDAQAQWKEIGPVPREQEDALWERFRTPLDAYFEAHRERTAGDRALREAGATAKEELCVEAENLLAAVKAAGDAAHWKTGIETVKDMQARWKETPLAPRHRDQALWKRFRAACDEFFELLKASHAERDRALNDNLARKRDLCFAVELYTGLPPENDEARAERDAWVEAQRAAGRPVPTVSDTADDWAARADKVKALQREWRDVGPAPRAEHDAMWTRFRKACDLFFEEARRAENRPGDDVQHNLEDKLALIARAEELALDPARRHEATVDELRHEWRRIGPVPRARSAAVWDRFHAACEAAVPRRRG